METNNGHAAITDSMPRFNDYDPRTQNATSETRRPGPRVSEGQVLDIILKMHSDLFEHGRDRAQSRRDVDPNENDLRALEDHAEAMAKEAYRQPYDPTNNEEHKLREAEYQKLKAAQPEAELVFNYAEADVAKLEDEMSRVQSNMQPPTKAQVVMFSAVAGLALTIAPTLHDFIFITMTDDILNWGVSVLSAAIYGVFITWGLLDADNDEGHRTVRNGLGLAGGITVPIGLGLLRVANAGGKSEMLFALALTVVELGIVALLESRAVSLRVTYQQWTSQQEALRDLTVQLDAARSRLERARQELKRIRDAILQHIRLVEELSVRNFNIERITADAIKAVRDGYFQGLAKNRGYLRGLKEVA